MTRWDVMATLTGVALCALVRPAFAQVEATTQQSSRRVEVGQTFQVQLSLMSSDDIQPTNARLPVPANVQVSGPRTSTQTQVSITNGRMVQRAGVTLTWVLTASKPGTYRIGPPTVDVGAQKVTGKIATFEVVEPGQNAQPGRGLLFPFDPFDPFGGMRLPGFPGFPFDDRGEPQDDALPPVPPEYQIERALDPLAFVVAKVRPRKVVLGQAINYAVYSYGARGGYQMGSATEPSRDGFLAYDVELAGKQNAVAVPLNDTTWVAAKLKQMVLFPIRSGTLHIGAMTVGFQGRGYPATPGSPALMRKTAAIEISVVEPPVAGRPAGYRLGDVGRYKLDAEVEPRKIRQGDAISVIAKLEGEGNVPNKLILPEQNGVDWMDPSVIHKVDAESGKVRGSRIFTFVVRVDRPGRIDLGELSLPYYDPEARRYEIARAALGVVEVEPNPDAVPAPTSKAGGNEDRLKGLLEPRPTLGEARATPVPLDERPSFFIGLLVAPLAVAAGTGLFRLGRRTSEGLRARKDTPARRALRELEEARRAAAAGDVGLTSAAVERAVHHAIEGATAIRGRGLLRSELGAALYAHGLTREVADEVVAILQATETARFVEGEAGAQALELVERGARAVEALKRGARG